MTADASFEDGAEHPLRLVAMDGDDLQVLSALCQDAVFPSVEMQWQPKRRRFGILLNRLRWEDVPLAQRAGRKPERVQSVLAVENVLRVSSQGVDRSDADTILSVLAVAFDAQENAVLLTLAGMVRSDLWLKSLKSHCAMLRAPMRLCPVKCRIIQTRSQES